eukprot:5848786-Pyramimonas_sp.AAC.1
MCENRIPSYMQQVVNHRWVRGVLQRVRVPQVSGRRLLGRLDPCTGVNAVVFHIQLDSIYPVSRALLCRLYLPEFELLAKSML